MIDVNNPTIFPRMLYHVSLDPIIVNNEDEQAKQIKRGYTTDRINVAREVQLEKEIAFHYSEIARLKAELEELGIPTELPKSPDEPQTAKEDEKQPKKGGRPRKDKGDDALGKMGLE